MNDNTNTMAASLSEAIRTEWMQQLFNQNTNN